jgi:hypothetical protein
MLLSTYRLLLVLTTLRTTLRAWRATLAALAALGLLSCNVPPPPPEPPPPLARVPEDYWVEAQGTVSISGEDEGAVRVDPVSVPGRARLRYLVYHDGRVTVPQFSAWLDDMDLVVRFSWWELGEDFLPGEVEEVIEEILPGDEEDLEPVLAVEPLRCTSFRSPKVIEASLEGSQLTIPAGAELVGWSHFRGSGGQCSGDARYLGTSTPTAFHATHLPAEDRFELSASFDTEVEGHAVTVSLDLEGGYLNRPPVAVIRAEGEGVAVAPDGCPSTEKGDPPIAVANTPQGLEVLLRSDSFDPDGVWPGEDPPKGLRVDLTFEQWERTRGAKFSFLGSGREVGPVLFETGQEHQLLLWATDRRGAEARQVCHFQVVEAE